MQVHFTENKGLLVFTEAGVRLMQGVCLIWGPLNTGFTVIEIPAYAGPETEQIFQRLFRKTTSLSICFP